MKIELTHVFFTCFQCKTFYLSVIKSFNAHFQIENKILHRSRPFRKAVRQKLTERKSFKRQYIKYKSVGTKYLTIFINNFLVEQNIVGGPIFYEFSLHFTSEIVCKIYK